jgi:hypothetical protein
LGRGGLWAPDVRRPGDRFRERAYVVGFGLNGRSRLLTPGKVGGPTLKDACDAAREALGKVAAGADPIAAKKRAGANTVAALAEAFLAAAEVRRLRTAAGYKRVINREIVPAFGTMKPGELGRTELRAWADSIHK